MSNNKQSSVEWLMDKLFDPSYMQKEQLEWFEQAKEMEVAGKEMSYADGYKEGYNRAIELTKWTISNLIPPPL
jgi:hypothetical protein